MSVQSGMKWPIAAPYTVPALAALCHSLYFLPRTVDDLFIFLRYAEHLSQGHGLVYNLGERVEGFSSPVWTLLLSLGDVAGLGGVTLSKVLGLASLLAVIWAVVHTLLVRLKTSQIVALTAGLLIASNSYIVSWSVLGLETPLHLALLLWGLNGLLISIPTRRQTLLCGVVLGFLALSRPEGALDVAGLTLGAAVSRYTQGNFRQAWQYALVPALVAAALWGSYEVFRLAYYGLPFPHTYYAKPGRGFNVNRWSPLIRNGASIPEVTLLFGGAVAVFFGPRTLTIPLASLIATRMYFIGAVEVDWMPNIRHFQPIYAGLIILVTHATHRIMIQSRLNGSISLAIIAISLFWAWLPIDSRFGPWDFKSHGQGKTWVRTKTTIGWQDAKDALRRIPPKHVKTRGPGMLQQAYNVMNASANPMAQEWYIGRDIGRLGWLTPINVIDTAGLFTPSVVRSAHWKKTMKADQEMLLSAFQRTVVATELFDGWARAARYNETVRARYRPVYPGNWHYLTPKKIVRPTMEERIKRYRYALSRLPTRYYAMTLYGEAVGAILERDLKKMERRYLRTQP